MPIDSPIVRASSTVNRGVVVVMSASFPPSVPDGSASGIGGDPRLECGVPATRCSVGAWLTSEPRR